MAPPRPIKWACAAALALVAVTNTPAIAAKRTAPTVPNFSHVVVVFLENEDASKTFEDGTGAPHLAAIRQAGAYVPEFYGVNHASLSNYEAFFGGVVATSQGKSDCLGQPWGTCVFPAGVPTIADGLDAKGKSWRVYSEGMYGAPGGGPCLHSPSRYTADPYQGPMTNGYATRHNPVAWFDSILTKGGSEDYCKVHNVDFINLWDDADHGRLPAFSFIEPDTCHDGHDTSTLGGCALDPEGRDAPAGVAAMDDWLPGFVDRLTSSPSWDRNSVLFITFDESEASDGGACPCNDGSVGGRIGLVVLGKRIVPGSTSTWTGSHYGLLRTIEDAWGLPRIAESNNANATSLTDIWSKK